MIGRRVRILAHLYSLFYNGAAQPCVYFAHICTLRTQVCCKCVEEEGGRDQSRREGSSRKYSPLRLDYRMYVVGSDPAKFPNPLSPPRSAMHSFSSSSSPSPPPSSFPPSFDASTAVKEDPQFLVSLRLPGTSQYSLVETFLVRLLENWSPHITSQAKLAK